MAQPLEYDIQPQGKVLQDYYDCREHVQIIIGPLGSGKTIQTCLKIVDLMCEQEPNKYNIRQTRWLAVRNTYSELFSTTIKDWLECHKELGDFKHGSKEPPVQNLSFDLPDGTQVISELIFVAFDRPDHVKKARGLQLTGVWLNEVKELTKPVIDILDLRHGRYPSKLNGSEPTWHGMLGDTNAPDKDHWLYRLAEEEKPDGWAIFKQPGAVLKKGDKWKVNPDAENAKNLINNYYERGMQAKSDDWIRVNLGNEYGFVATGKPVHPRYVDSVHCQDIDFEPDTDTQVVLGFDFGRTPACAFIQKTSSGSWVCFDEFLAEDMSAVTFAPELSRYITANYPALSFKGWGDPSGDSKGQGTDDTPIKILQANGIPCQGTIDNNVLQRRSAIENPLIENAMDGRPRLIILPKAKMVRKGLMGGFCYRRVMVNYDEKYTDEPDKNKYSHIVEALEYGLYGEGEGRAVMKFEDQYDDWSIPINA